MLTLPPAQQAKIEEAVRAAASELPMTRSLYPDTDLPNYQAGDPPLTNADFLVRYREYLEIIHLEAWEEALRQREEHRSGAWEAPPALGILLSEVKQQRVRWLWKGRLAVGKLTILDGDPGTGKSVLYIDVAARITTARAWPDEQGVLPERQPAGVVIVTTEDGIADTIAPRAKAAGADLARIAVVQLIPERDGPGRVPVLPDDIELIMEACRRLSARLLVIDPLTAHLSGNANSYKDQDMRRVLAPLAEAAERYSVAVLVVRHLNKAPGGNPLYRGGGSIGIIGAARIGLMLGRDPQREDHLALASTKINVGAVPDTLALAVQPSAHDPDLPVIEWYGRSTLTARDLCVSPDQGRSKTEAAEAWLADYLATGPRPSIEVFLEGEEAGHSKKTLYRAKDRLEIETKKSGFEGGWVWELPEGFIPRRSPKVANSGDDHLRGSSASVTSGDEVPSPLAVALSPTQVPPPQ